MEFINKTPIPARLAVAETDEPELRAGTITAKVTYGFDASGEVTLETDEPYPVLLEDQETRLGLLPRDDLPRRDEVFEVICLGSAHAPGGRAVEHMTVSLQVGDLKRGLLITGDRTWQGARGADGVTEPVPFIRMPLTWARTFGGTAQVQIDPYTTVDVPHQMNPEGRGFDPSEAAEAMKAALQCPEGYPQVVEPRVLPNVEDPAAPVSRWEDQPEPACWATVPMCSAMQTQRAMEPPPPGPASPEEFAAPGYEPPLPSMPQVKDSALWRATPGGVMDAPPKEAEVVLEGLTPHGRVAFQLPTPSVSADYVVGEDQGVLQLQPQVLVLLPDERRFYLVFRHCFTLFFQEGQERSMRLRADVSDGGAP